MDTLRVLFLEDGGQPAEKAARWIAEIIESARHSVDLAIYDYHPEGEAAEILLNALLARQRAGVAVRIAYNSPPRVPGEGMVVEPAYPNETERFVVGSGLPAVAIGEDGSHLMHQKYMVVDAGTPEARVLAGSANFTTAAFTRQENNLLDIASPEIAALYAANFEDLWATRRIGEATAPDHGSAILRYAGVDVPTQVRFAPGREGAIDQDVAQRIRAAEREVTIASAVVSSSHILDALAEIMRRGVPISGIFDGTQMDPIVEGWRHSSSTEWKAETFTELVRYGKLHAKRAARAWPAGPHNYMHNKVIIVDDTVITGSYNFSRNAQLNAENILFFESPALAREYRDYIGRLLLRYPRA